MSIVVKTVAILRTVFLRVIFFKKSRIMVDKSADMWYAWYWIFVTPVNMPKGEIKHEAYGL